jgi:hypothetical protein
LKSNDPTDAKRALRASRSLMPAWPTRPRLIAAMAGPSTQLAAACSARPNRTKRNTGQIASEIALALIATTPHAARSRSERAASTTAPPGIWPIRAIRPPTVSTSPISTWVQACVVR